MKFGVRLLGVEGYVRAVNEISRGTGKAAMRSMEGGAAKRILARAVPLAPIDTGALRASGAVYPVRSGGTRWAVAIGFGNERVRYALVQHENLSYRHPRGGQAKYLSAAVRQEAAGAVADLAADVAASWKAIAK